MAGLPLEREEKMITADSKFQTRSTEVIRTGEQAVNQQSLIPGPNSAALAGKMICTKGKAYKMDDKSTSRYEDMTEKASERGDDKATSLARQMESDDASEFTGAGFIPTPERDSAAENKIATSLDDE